MFPWGDRPRFFSLEVALYGEREREREGGGGCWAVFEKKIRRGEIKPKSWGFQVGVGRTRFVCDCRRGDGAGGREKGKIKRTHF